MRSSRRLRNTNRSPRRMSRQNSDWTIAWSPSKLLRIRPAWRRGRSSSAPRETAARRRAWRRSLLHPLTTTSWNASPRRTPDSATNSARQRIASRHSAGTTTSAPDFQRKHNSLPPAAACSGGRPLGPRRRGGHRRPQTFRPIVERVRRHPLLLAESRHGNSASPVFREHRYPNSPLLNVP